MKNRIIKFCKKCQADKEFTENDYICTDCRRDYGAKWYAINRNPNAKKIQFHGKSGTLTYNSWSCMIGRCLRPTHKKYKDYGGRGIKVHQPWIDSFIQFLHDVGERPSKEHTLERIDNEKGYFPGNVKWALFQEQHRNKRNNVRITYQGISYLLCDLALVVGVHQKLLRTRLSQGMSIEDAVKQVNYKSKERLKEYQD